MARLAPVCMYGMVQHGSQLVLILIGLSYTNYQASQVCAGGWFLSDEAAWIALIDAHGGLSTTSSRLRAKPSANGSYWYRSADNMEFQWGTSETGVVASGFNALPSGQVIPDGVGAPSFSLSAYFWSSLESARSRYLSYTLQNVTVIPNATGYYYSVRCVKKTEL